MNRSPIGIVENSTTMKRNNLLSSLALTSMIFLLPSQAMAHPGHTADATYGLSHFLLQPAHLPTYLSVAGVVVSWLLIVMLRRRAAGTAAA